MFMTTSFLGSVVGHVVFGYVSDIFGRELALKLSSVILVIFAILSSLSLADSLELRSSLILLSVMRFFLGIGIGGIMPAASVATFEAISMTMNPRTSSNNTSNSLYVLATTLIIDIGLLFSSFMPWLLVKVINVESARRLSAYCLAVGIIPLIFILSLVYLKWPGLFADSNTRGKDCTSDIRLSPSQITLQIDPTPCKNLTMKAILVTTIWFVYDLMIYPLNYYSSIIVSGEPISDVDKKDLKELLTISLIVSIFYVPGPLIAARMMLRMSPMSVLKTGLYLQVAASTAIFIYTLLSSTRYVPVISALFCFLLFSSELGLGSCIGIYANKSFPRNVRLVCIL